MTKTALIGFAVIGSLVPGAGADAAPAPTVLPARTALIGFGVVGNILLGTGGATGGTPTPPATNARVSQEVLEVVAATAVTANVRVTQEVLEAIVAPAANARVSQEVLEAVLRAEPPSEGSWTVETSPRVYWGTVPGGIPGGGIVVGDSPTHPRGEWKVRAHPRVSWDAGIDKEEAEWVVHTAPQVIWETNLGTATTECVSGPGEVPPPEDEPPAEGGEVNYVF